MVMVRYLFVYLRREGSDNFAVNKDNIPIGNQYGNQL